MAYVDPSTLFADGVTYIQASSVRHALEFVHDYRCQYCRRKSNLLESDHIYPRSLGGPDALENYLPACSACNHRKFDGLLTEDRLYELVARASALAPAVLARLGRSKPKVEYKYPHPRYISDRDAVNAVRIECRPDFKRGKTRKPRPVYVPAPTLSDEQKRRLSRWLDEPQRNADWWWFTSTPRRVKVEEILAHVFGKRGVELYPEGDDYHKVEWFLKERGWRRKKVELLTGKGWYYVRG